MLEAKDFRALAMVFPFIGAHIDGRCSEASSAPITSVYTQCSDLLNFIRRDHLPPDWSETDLQALQHSSIAFKSLVFQIFHPFHPTQLAFLKFHLLDHLVEDLLSRGSIQHMDVGVYENSHLIFKSQYKRTFRRRSTAMQDTIARIEHSNKLNDLRNSLPDIFHSQESTSTSFTPRYLLPTGATLVKDASSTTFQQFIHGTLECSPLLIDIKVQPHPFILHPLRESYSSSTLDLILQLGDQGPSTFINLLKEQLSSHGSSASSTSVNISIVKSAFVVGGYLPIMDDYDSSQNSLASAVPQWT